MNARDQPVQRPAIRLLARAGGRLAPLLLLVAILALLGLREVSSSSQQQAAAVVPLSAARAAAASVDLGVTTPQLARNEWRTWRPADLGSVSAFEVHAHKHLSVIMWYSDWRHNSVSSAQLQAVARRGSVPEITWEPWDFSQGSYHAQPKYDLASIIDGSHDAYVRSWARALAAYGKPVRLRFAQEMNGNWYPWVESAYGNHSGQFVRAWRHVHDIFRAAGASNVKWVWSPVAIANSIHAEQYPGDAYVDMVGLSLFNGGAQLKFNHWQSFAQKIDRPLSLLRAIAPSKPVEISEVGTAEQGGSKPQWIRDMFTTLRQNPQITSLVWFDVPTSSDWRIESSRASEHAFAAGAADPRYR